MIYIYLIPKSVPCPICGSGRATIGELALDMARNYSYEYKCYACENSSRIIDWIGKYVGVIKNVGELSESK